MGIPRRPSRRVAVDEDGSAIEAVIVVPVAMFIVFLAVQACLWAHADALVQSAAALGDQAACLQGSSDQVGVDVARNSLAATGHGVVSSVAVQSEDLPGDAVQMHVTGMAESIVPWVHLSVSAVRVGLRQEFRISG